MITGKTTASFGADDKSVHKTIKRTINAIVQTVWSLTRYRYRFESSFNHMNYSRNI